MAGQQPGKGGEAAMADTRQIGRDAKTGEFITVEEARRRKATAIVETIKTPKKK
jgi:hypothetical protein